MKKKLIYLSIVLLTGALLSCQSTNIQTIPTTTNSVNSSPTQFTNSEYLSMICEVDSMYAEGGSSTVSSMPIESVSDSAKREITMEISGISRHLSYHRTLHYPIGGETVHQYLVDYENNGSILLNQDGTIHSFLCTFATLNISKTESPEQILPLLKAELEKWVDLDQYEYVDLPESVDDADGFGIYNFRFYNQIAGYVTDSVMVAVNSSGAVFGCRIRKLPEDDISLNIDKKLEQELIELKMKNIYSTSDTKEYKSNSIKEHSAPQLKMYNNELCVEYYVSAILINKESGNEISSFIHTILIPVKLITSETISQ